MAKQKRPVLYNTTHKYNFTLYDNSQIGLRKTVNSDNIDELTKEFTESENDIISKLSHLNDVYEVHEDSQRCIDLIKIMSPKVAHIYYYTDHKVPEEILKCFDQYSNGTVVYLWDSLGDNYSIIQDVQRSFKATEIYLKVKIVLPEVDPEQLLFGLYQVHACVDQIQFEFPHKSFSEVALLNDKYYQYNEKDCTLTPANKFICFKRMQQPLSVWGMGIQINVENSKEKALLRYYRECDEGNITEDQHKVKIEELIGTKLK